MTTTPPEKAKDIRQEQEIAQQTVIEDEALDTASASSALAEKLKEKRTQQKKKQLKHFVIFFTLVLFGYGIYYLLAPFKGGLSYCICKTFLELNVPYPETILLSEVVITRNGGVRIWFTHTDAFGSYRLDAFQCTFGVDEQTKQSYLAEVKMGKLNIDPIVVERFNLSIPYLVANPPDLTLPVPIPDSLESIEFDLDRFRKKIF